MKSIIFNEPTFTNDLQKLLRFESSLDPKNNTMISIEEYLTKMKPWQKEIYFVNNAYELQLSKLNQNQK